jgi:hypothetical protein
VSDSFDDPYVFSSFMYRYFIPLSIFCVVEGFLHLLDIKHSVNFQGTADLTNLSMSVLFLAVGGRI